MIKQTSERSYNISVIIQDKISVFPYISNPVYRNKIAREERGEKKKKKKKISPDDKQIRVITVNVINLIGNSWNFSLDIALKLFQIYSMIITIYI